MNNVNISVEECRLALLIIACHLFYDVVCYISGLFFNPEIGLSLFRCLYSISVSLYMFTTVKNFYINYFIKLGCIKMIREDFFILTENVKQRIAVILYFLLYYSSCNHKNFSINKQLRPHLYAHSFVSKSKWITIKCFNWLTAFIFYIYLIPADVFVCFYCWSALIAIYVSQSRSRQEDPEQLRLKQKAKEVRWHTWDAYLVRGPLCLITGQSWYIYMCVWLQMQQQELAQIRQREANLTALAAIGPRKKRKLDSPSLGTDTEVPNSSPSLWQSASPSVPL